MTTNNIHNSAHGERTSLLHPSVEIISNGAENGEPEDAKHRRSTNPILLSGFIVALLLGGSILLVGQNHRRERQTIIVLPDPSVAATDDSSSHTSTTDTTIHKNNKKITDDDAYSDYRTWKRPPPQNPIDILDDPFQTKVGYRPVCEYYYSAAASAGENNNRRSSSSSSIVASPRILQTSLMEPSKPWSLRPCVAAADPTVVPLNAAAAPDAILQVEFSNMASSFDTHNHRAPSSSPGTASSTKASSSTKTTTSTAAKLSAPNVILGFGGAFTEAASLNFHTLSALAQETVLELLFGSSGLGYSMGRVPIHSCDFSVASYTFDEAEDDFELHHFDDTLLHDADTIRMVTRAAATYNRAIWNNRDAAAAAADENGDEDDSYEYEYFDEEDDTIHEDNGNLAADRHRRHPNANAFRLFASPWSPPAWMKRPTWEDDKHAKHATKMTYSAHPTCLRDGVGPDSQYAAAWALYFSKYIAAYQRLSGVPVWAVTVQNEPEFAAPWEACSYTAHTMTDFVAYHLGPVLKRDHPEVKILAFDHNKDHINTWMMTMLNGTRPFPSDNANNKDDDDNDNKDLSQDWRISSSLAAEYVSGTAYHWYAGGMDRLLDGALGTSNLHRLRENLSTLDRSHDIVLGTEACHCPTTGYAGGTLNINWNRAERYAHTILADLAAGSQGWVEWNLILDSIGGPNHLGNLCEATLLSAPHRAIDADGDISPLPDFEEHGPMFGRIIGDEQTREELNARGFPAKYLDLGIVVQPMYYYMGHISRHVRPGSISVPGLVRQSLGNAETFRPVGSTVAGGGVNDLARDGIELLLWPCEGSTRQQFRWNLDRSHHISVFGHDWLGNQTESCVGREVDPDLLSIRLGQCWPDTTGEFEFSPIADDSDGRFHVRLLNHPDMGGQLCLSILELRNNGGSYGPLGGAQVTLGDCSLEAAKWHLDGEAGRASTTFFADAKSDNELCITTGWPFLQMGAFLTPNGSAPKTVVILNEAQDSANYALKDNDNVLLTGSIPPRSIQTVLLG